MSFKVIRSPSPFAGFGLRAVITAVMCCFYTQSRYLLAPFALAAQLLCELLRGFGRFLLSHTVMRIIVNQKQQLKRIFLNHSLIAGRPYEWPMIQDKKNEKNISFNVHVYMHSVSAIPSAAITRSFMGLRVMGQINALITSSSTPFAVEVGFEFSTYFSIGATCELEFAQT